MLRIDENVLVIGAGASGIDIAIQLSRVAKRVTLSRNKHSRVNEEQHRKRHNSFPAKITSKHNVKRFTANGAEFIDGTKQTFSLVIYATGTNVKIFSLKFDDILQSVTFYSSNATIKIQLF